MSYSGSPAPVIPTSDKTPAPATGEAAPHDYVVVGGGAGGLELVT